MYPLFKRSADIALALLGLCVLLPLSLPLILLLRLTGEGEVFYRQSRVGRYNGTFGIWKFATMLKNSSQMGTGSLTLRRDPRVTPVGRILRKTKINELPQLLNVLTGDMSFVGPRPQMRVDFEAYSPDVQARIYSVPPGVTGIGSIIFRDEEKWMSETSLPVRQFYEQEIAPYKGALEMWYLHHQSFRTDFLLLLLTAWMVFFPNSQLAFRVFPTLPLPPAYITSAHQ